MKTFKTIDEIRTERQAQRNNKVVYNLLGVLMGELDRRPNQNTPITETDIYKNIKKLYEAAIECGNEDEKVYLEQFIKKQMTRERIEFIVVGLLEDPTVRNIGDVMKAFATYYPGQYDGKTVSTIAKKYLK